MISMKLTKIGNSLGFVLPREAAQRLKVEKGDTIYLTEAPGGFRLVSYDPEFEAQTRVAERIMRKRRNALRALAK